jgi:hypothetical protein
MTTMTKDQRTERMVEAILTSATCGDGCWYAREKVCRCSCGGKNHGCLLEAGAERPARTSRIQGTLYELSAVGKYGDLVREAADALKTIGPREVTAYGYKYYWRPTDAGSPVYLKCATKQQLGAWRELSGALPGTYLLWKAVTK